MYLDGPDQDVLIIEAQCRPQGGTYKFEMNPKGEAPYELLNAPYAQTELYFGDQESSAAFNGHVMGYCQLQALLAVQFELHCSTTSKL